MAFCTPEAERVAGLHGYMKVMLPALGLWETICPKLKAPLFHEDNQAMIMVVTSGRNPTMRHLGRVHRVSLQWLHERLGKHTQRDRTILYYENTDNMSADIYTKASIDATKWSHALQLINILTPAQLKPEAILAWHERREELLKEVFQPEEGASDLVVGRDALCVGA